MVDKDMFKSMLLDELYKQLPDDFTLSVKEVFKSNDARMTGININREGSAGGCVIYAEDLYGRYQNGEELSSMVSDLMGEITKSDIYSMDLGSFTRDDMMAHTSYRMANKFTNQLRLMDVPTRDVPGMTDIVIYPVYEVQVGTRRGTVLISNSMLESNHVSVQEIHAAAEANTERRMAIVPLSERLQGLMGGMEFPDGEEIESPFLVSYDRESSGDEASVLGAPKALASLKEPYYVIPSSTHELLFLPKSFEADVDNLKRLVSEVNSTVLDPKDVLSNNVYELDQGRFVTHEAGAGLKKQFVQE
ncbi:MAG: DUF5688 family protein [Eubacterium sp.]|nr:DUF5688 family protein [Eubacterium sp.]